MRKFGLHRIFRLISLLWCEENDLLSPIYTNAARGGCWFCHNQTVDQLRLLRKEYPDLWELLLKWDWDSPITFKPMAEIVANIAETVDILMVIKPLYNYKASE